MNIKEQIEKLEKINELKKNKNYKMSSLKELQSLPKYNGVLNLKFNSNNFFMLNIENDDAVPLKYLWRDGYEKLSLDLWYKITREDGYFLDIGAHTGIYSIIGNLNTKKNNIISIEPYFLNYSRLLSNLKLNNISTINTFFVSASNDEGIDKFLVKTRSNYHSSGGRISKDGNLNVVKNKIDNFKLNKKLVAMKIDTEGHEFEVLEGAQNYINQYRPKIIFEINEKSFDKCLDLIKKFNYKFFYLNEKEGKIFKIEKFDKYLLSSEGANCYATTENILPDKI